MVRRRGETPPQAMPDKAARHRLDRGVPVRITQDLVDAEHEDDTDVERHRQQRDGRHESVDDRLDRVEGVGRPR